MNSPTNIEMDDLAKPLTYPVEAFLSRDYARAEKEKLWPKVWQVAARVEELPEVGDWLTYDICDDSFIIIRTAPDRLKAFYNVCPHRGRQLVDVPEGVHSVTGNKRRNFICGFHG